MKRSLHKKDEKIEMAKHLINMHRKIQSNTNEIRRLDKKIESVRLEGIEERRRLDNRLKRSIWEVLQISIGNRKQVEKMSHRVDDTSERLDKIEEVTDWVMKTLIGLFITTVFGAIIMYVISKF